jgi:hypothetical protein
MGSSIEGIEKSATGPDLPISKIGDLEVARFMSASGKRRASPMAPPGPPLGVREAVDDGAARTQAGLGSLSIPGV